MPDNGELNYEPKITTQVIPSGYTSGGTITGVTSAIDNNIIPENIRKGVTILEVEGSFEGSTGGDATSDGNLQAKYLLEGYTAVVDGKLIEGTMKEHNDVVLEASEETIEIPEGHYDYLYILELQASNCSGYTECLEAMTSI